MFTLHALSACHLESTLADIIPIGLHIGALALTLDTGSWTPPPREHFVEVFICLLGIPMAVEQSDPRKIALA
eukprot:5221880-Alexandrium_andersonii.AAC.1